MTDPKPTHTGKSYKINTLADMARIPKEREAAFLLELPRILDIVRQAQILADEFDTTVLHHPEWLDDGKTEEDVTVQII